MTSVAEGGAVELTVSVLPPDGKQSAATVVRLEALADEFVNDDRLTLSLVTTGQATHGAGSVDGSFEIEIRDTTVKQIAPRSDAAVKQAFDAASAVAAGMDGLNPGETFSVAVSELFNVLATAAPWTTGSRRPTRRCRCRRRAPT